MPQLVLAGLGYDSFGQGQAIGATSELCVKGTAGVSDARAGWAQEYKVLMCIDIVVLVCGVDFWCGGRAFTAVGAACNCRLPR